MRRLLPLILLPIAHFAAGCNPAASEADDTSTTPKKQAVTFQGQVDPKFVGLWKTENDSSCLDLRKDGTLGIANENPTPRGVVKSNIEGKWLVSGSDLMLRYQASKMPETTIKYAAELAGDKMTLGKDTSVRQIYIRKSKDAKKSGS